MSDKTREVIVKDFKDIQSQLNEHFYERSAVITSIFTGLLSNLNVMLVGPPGTAKTAISECFSSHVSNGNYFGTTLHPFTSPDELFGAWDLLLMKEEGTYHRRTEGYLPSAHIVAIEEIFKAGKGTLNSLIEVAHPDRYFSNGAKKEKTPILSMIGTSNELPIGETDLQAIYDRMIIKMWVKPISDVEKFKAMLGNTKKYDPKVKISVEDIIVAREYVDQVVVSDSVRQRITVLRGKLAEAGIFPSDRTMKLCVGALKAHAFLNDREEVDDDDIVFLRNLLWYEPSDAETVWRVIIDLVKPEFKRLGQILEATSELVKKHLPKDKKTRPNISNLGGAHVQIQKYVDEAMQIKHEMKEKDRDLEECEEIIYRLRSHLSAVGKVVIGHDEVTGESMY